VHPKTHWSSSAEKVEHGEHVQRVSIVVAVRVSAHLINKILDNN